MPEFILRYSKILMMVLEAVIRDIASDADRHLDITFGLQLVESSSIVSVLFREAFNHPYISFLHCLVNGFLLSESAVALSM